MAILAKAKGPEDDDFRNFHAFTRVLHPESSVACAWAWVVAIEKEIAKVEVCHYW